MARPSNESTAGLLGESASELADVLLETYSVNDAMNQLLLAHLDPRAWRAGPPGAGGRGRTIAAIFAFLGCSTGTSRGRIYVNSPAAAKMLARRVGFFTLEQMQSGYAMRYATTPCGEVLTNK